LLSSAISHLAPVHSPRPQASLQQPSRQHLDITDDTSISVSVPFPSSPSTPYNDTYPLMSMVCQWSHLGHVDRLCQVSRSVYFLGMYLHWEAGFYNRLLVNSMDRAMLCCWIPYGISKYLFSIVRFRMCVDREHA